MSTVSDLYEKYRNGRPISDVELKIGIKHFDEMSRMLFEAGPVFALAAAEANRVYLTLVDYQEARKRDR